MTDPWIVQPNDLTVPIQLLVPATFAKMMRRRRCALNPRSSRTMFLLIFLLITQAKHGIYRVVVVIVQWW